MLWIETFTKELAASMREHSHDLKKGDLFLPEYLKGKVFTKQFRVVMETLSQRIGMRMSQEFMNEFLADYEIGNPQRVDFTFFEKNSNPFLFLELESLDRAQLYLFTDGHVSNNISKDNDNKLWYYYGTLGNHYSANRPIPRYFVFLLMLPERNVDPYTIWDIQKPYRLYHPNLKKVVFANPFEFYDLQIKASARGFLRSENCAYFKINGKWPKLEPSTYQRVCELIFITCTCNKLILSRGRHLFDPATETCYQIKWRD